MLHRVDGLLMLITSVWFLANLSWFHPSRKLFWLSNMSLGNKNCLMALLLPHFCPGNGCLVNTFHHLSYGALNFFSSWLPRWLTASVPRNPIIIYSCKDTPHSIRYIWAKCFCLRRNKTPDPPQKKTCCRPENRKPIQLHHPFVCLMLLC